MPPEKECTRLIPRIYKINAENQMLFAWVNAQKQLVPAITIEQSIWNYFKFMDIEWDMESAIMTFARLQKEYLKDC